MRGVPPRNKEGTHQHLNNLSRYPLIYFDSALYRFFLIWILKGHFGLTSGPIGSRLVFTAKASLMSDYTSKQYLSGLRLPPITVMTSLLVCHERRIWSACAPKSRQKSRHFVVIQQSCCTTVLLVENPEPNFEISSYSSTMGLF